MSKFTIFEFHEDERSYNEGLAKHEFQVVPRIGEMIIVEDKYYEVLQVVHYVSGDSTRSDYTGERLPYTGSIYVKACNVPNDERYPYLPVTTFDYFKEKFKDLEK